MEEKKNSKKSIIIEILIYIVILFLCIYVVPQYVIQRTVVDGESMMIIFIDGDSMIVNKF